MRDGPADNEEVGPNNLFSGQSGSQGLAMFCTTLQDVEQNCLTKLPSFEGVFLAIGQAGEECRVCTAATIFRNSYAGHSKLTVVPDNRKCAGATK